MNSNKYAESAAKYRAQAEAARIELQAATNEAEQTVALADDAAKNGYAFAGKFQRDADAAIRKQVQASAKYATLVSYAQYAEYMYATATTTDAR